MKLKNVLGTLALIIAMLVPAFGQAPATPQFQNIYINDTGYYGHGNVVTQFQMSPNGALLDTHLSYDAGSTSDGGNFVPQALATYKTSTTTCLFASGTGGGADGFIPEVQAFSVAVGGNLTAVGGETQLPNAGNSGLYIMPDILAYKGHLYAQVTSYYPSSTGNTVYTLSIANNCSLTLGAGIPLVAGAPGAMAAGAISGGDYLLVPIFETGNSNNLSLVNVSGGGFSLVQQVTWPASAAAFQTSPSGSVFWTLDFDSTGTLVISSWGVVAGSLTAPVTYRLSGGGYTIQYGYLTLSNSYEAPALYTMGANGTTVWMNKTQISGTTLEIGGTVTKFFTAAGNVGQMTEDVNCNFVMVSEKGNYSYPNELETVFAELPMAQVVGSPFSGPTFSPDITNSAATAVPPSVYSQAGCAAGN